MTTNSRLKTSALAYALIGFNVLPCAPNGKNPATAHGFHDATTDPTKIEAFWEQNPNFNIGICTGTLPTGWCLVVLDKDPRNGGNDTLSKLLTTYGPLPDTAKVITGRQDGGEHYYFLYKPGVKLKAKLGAGVDLKSVGGYVIAPPSIHPETGLPYEWDPAHSLLAGAGIAALPQWIIDICSRDAPATILTPASSVGVVFVDDDTVRDLRSALFSMRADDRDLWVRMGLALKELGDIGRGLWMEWSSQSEKFKPQDAARTWESFK